MIFNSIDFAIFLPIVFLSYWFLTKRDYKLQNILLLVASYLFYGCWDWRFLFLLIFSTGLDYFTGLKMANAFNIRNKKFWFWLSIVVNLGFLGVFKYYNFFITSFAQVFGHLGLQVNYSTLQIILPVGISFYTFHGLSYVIDIYYDRIKPERNFIDYSLFVSFFPLLVAGPIERATHLLPQIKRNRKFDYNNAVDGCRQILWGLFKKIVIADNCATYVNQVFNDYQHQTGSTLFLSAVLFAFQIYGDFSGYSDIAIGTARLFGIELLRNFSFPYFSRDIAEFWRRWHISLTTWFRDYLYIPLGGNKNGKWKAIRNTFIIFLISGFWHGANWTFIAWGGFHALLFLPLLLMKKNRKHINSVAEGRNFPSIMEIIQIATTFILVTIGWIFFRAPTIGAAIEYIQIIFTKSFQTTPFLINKDFYIPLILNIFILISVEWFQREKRHGLEINNNSAPLFRIGIYMILFLLIFWFGASAETFIYFQF